ncbi:hypothetical protein DICPUDRAFT_40780, partial [Dictyostelium purpureum]
HKMKNPFKNFKISEYYPIKYDKKLNKYKVFGTSPIHCGRMVLVILSLWAFFIGLFLVLLYGFGRDLGVETI